MKKTKTFRKKLQTKNSAAASFGGACTPLTISHTVEYLRLKDSDLNTINELKMLFPNWERTSLLKKIKKTQKGKDVRFVAKQGGVIIAHVKVAFGKGLHKHRAEMTSLTVFSPYRRRGIATVLTTYALQNLPKKITLVTLAVDRKNKNAIKLYKKLGFAQFGLLKKASKINGKFVDNVLMNKQL